MQKQFSQACVNNRQAILAVLQQYLVEPQSLLEIGSGTGQHAVYMAQHLPFVQWHTSNYGDLESIRAWIADSQLDNVVQPLSLDVRDEWRLDFEPQALYSANTLHIMSWPSAQLLLAKAGSLLASGDLLFIYGPFNYGGAYTSDSNADFDLWLKARDPESGIRDFEAVERVAAEQGLALKCDHTMPANNRMLVFVKR